VISILYGHQFDDSARVLAVHIFGVVFVWQGAATYLWWIARRRPRVIMWRYLAAAAVNLLLNAMLIPSFGALGAAVASVVAQAVVSIGINPFLGRNGRLLLRLQTTPGIPVLQLARLIRQAPV
jgi:O-antigen/teichoic acid export membrane protein